MKLKRTAVYIRAISMIIGAFLIAIIQLGFVMVYLSAEVVKADEPSIDASEMIVEAEDCLAGTVAECSVAGSWKSWYMPEFSNGTLLTNEHPVKAGLSLPATLTLNFTGTGTCIIYRQDTWYGTLGIKIDDQPEYLVSQQGNATNQAKACFEVENNIPVSHTLVLSAGQVTGPITGVITVDAIRVLEGDDPCGSEESLCDRQIIVPAYFYPDLPDGYWGKLADAATEVGDRLVVIANVFNGPGLTRTITYTNAISEVVSNGGRVIGYVHTCYGKQQASDPIDSPCIKTEAEVQQDIDNWYEFYPMITGIFFDEVSTNPDLVPYYKRLYDYVQGKQTGAIVVFNFGVEPHPDYLSIGSSVLCTFEGSFSGFMEWLPPNWLPRARSCALVYETDDLPNALMYLSQKNVGSFYFTSDTMVPDSNPWDILPDYFPDLVNAILCTKTYLPIVVSQP